MQPDAAIDQPGSSAGDHWRDELLGAVANQQGREDLLATKDITGMLGDVLGQLAVGGVRQVVAERDHDPGLLAQPEHDQAPARIEAEQVRDHGQDGIGSAGAKLYLAGQTGGPGRRRGLERTRGALARLIVSSHAASMEIRGRRRPASISAGGQLGRRLIAVNRAAKTR